MTLAEARALFEPDPHTIYLDAGTYGLPPRPVPQAIAAALDNWKTGRADFERDWEPAGERARELFARLIGASPAEIALVPALQLLLRWQADGTLVEARALADRLANGLGLAKPGASLVCAKIEDSERVAAALDAAGLRCAARGKYIRMSPHVYNTADEIDRAVTIVNAARFRNRPP